MVNSELVSSYSVNRKNLKKLENEIRIPPKQRIKLSRDIL